MDFGDANATAFAIDLDTGIKPYTPTSTFDPDDVPGLELVMRQFSVRERPEREPGRTPV